MNEKLDISKLVSALDENNNNYINPINNKKIKKDIKEFQVNKKIKKIKNLAPKEQKKLERQENFKVIKDDLNKWDTVVKMNRISEQLDFTGQGNNLNNENLIQDKNNKNNDFDFKNQILSKLKKKNLDSYKNIKKRENTKINNLNNGNKEKNLKNIKKQKELLLYKEIKDKRIKKIKSKLYRKIRKKKKINEELEKEDMMRKIDKEYNLEVIEKQERKRALERIQLKHRNDIKYAKQLKRYADKKAYQNTITNLEKEKREYKKKLDDHKNDSDISILSDDSNMDEEVINKLEAELNRIESDNEENDNIIDKIIKNGKEKTKGELQFLINKIKQKKYEDIVSDIEEESAEEYDDYGELVKKEKKSKKIENNDLMEDGRKKYETKEKLAKFNDKVDLIDNNINLEKNIIKDINIDNLEKKYQNKDSLNFKNDDMKLFVDEDKKNNNELYDNFDFNVVSNLNQDEFLKEKEKEVANELNESQYKVVKGWGSWTGIGVQEDPLKQKKLDILKNKKIEEIKKNRLDNKNKNFIINEEKDKNFDKYLLKKVPYPFKNKSEYDYANQQAVGSEWVGTSNFINNIKSKVKVLDGQVIKPISDKNMPKSKYL